MQKMRDQKEKQLSDNNLFKQKIDKLTKENNELSNQNKSKEKELIQMRLELNQIKRNKYLYILIKYI